MMAAGSQALGALQIKLQSQKFMADNLATIDGVSKELADSTNELGNMLKFRSGTELATLRDTLDRLDQAALENWKARETQNRLDAQAKADNWFNTFSDANKKYFNFIMTKKSASAANLTENLLKSYGQFLRTLTGGQSVADVMGPRYSTSASDYKAEQDLYLSN